MMTWRSIDVCSDSRGEPQICGSLSKVDLVRPCIQENRTARWSKCMGTIDRYLGFLDVALIPLLVKSSCCLRSELSFFCCPVRDFGHIPAAKRLLATARLAKSTFFTSSRVDFCMHQCFSIPCLTGSKTLLPHYPAGLWPRTLTLVPATYHRRQRNSPIPPQLRTKVLECKAIVLDHGHGKPLVLPLEGLRKHRQFGRDLRSLQPRVPGFLISPDALRRAGKVEGVAPQTGGP